MSKLTACKHCKHFYQSMFNKCHASPKPKAFDCIDGVFKDDGYFDCATINQTGTCQKYEEVRDERQKV